MAKERKMNTTEVEITSERIDDIPLILEWLQQLGIAKQIDKNLSRPHGNHQGLSYGQLSVLLLTYMITQQDHRLCAVEPWVKTHREILELSTGWTLGEKDASDDRLARVVEELGKQEEARQAIERKVGKLMIRGYELPTEVGRVDTSSFSVNHQALESEAESILRYGYSKDRRPDLLQYKQLLGTLDPAGIPLVSATVPGNGADDPLYWPAWQEMARVIGHKDFVFVADSKAAALATRARIADSEGIYSFPLPMSGQNPLWLQQWVLDPPAPPAEIRLPGQEADEPAVGKGFEVELGKFWWHPEKEQWVRWEERYLVVYSESLAAATLKGLHQRLERATAALKQLAAKPGDDLEQLDLKVKALLQRHRALGFLAGDYRRGNLERDSLSGARPSHCPLSYRASPVPTALFAV
jgi:transposase